MSIHIRLRISFINIKGERVRDERESIRDEIANIRLHMFKLQMCLERNRLPFVVYIV